METSISENFSSASTGYNGKKLGGISKMSDLNPETNCFIPLYKGSTAVIKCITDLCQTQELITTEDPLITNIHVNTNDQINQVTKNLNNDLQESSSYMI